MVFDEDVKLIGLYARYSEEKQELKTQIVKYISSEGTFDQTATSQSELDLVSSLVPLLISDCVALIACGQRDGHQEEETNDGQPAKATVALAIGVAASTHDHGL